MVIIFFQSHLPVCSVFQNVLLHFALCKRNKDCTFPECYHTRVIVNHYTSCKDGQCILCEPVINMTKGTQYERKNESNNEELVSNNSGEL